MPFGYTCFIGTFALGEYWDSRNEKFLLYLADVPESRSDLGQALEHVRTAIDDIEKLTNSQYVDEMIARAGASFFWDQLTQIEKMLNDAADVIEGSRPFWRQVEGDRKGDELLHECQELSHPMSKAELIRRIMGTDARPRKFEGYLERYGIRKVGRGYLWQICLDKLDGGTRRRLQEP